MFGALANVTLVLKKGDAGVLAFPKRFLHLPCSNNAGTNAETAMFKQNTQSVLLVIYGIAARRFRRHDVEAVDVCRPCSGGSRQADVLRDEGRGGHRSGGAAAATL